ncbi:hypothetical protein J3R82DRAFT_3680 [Butyriboletus roseoflavus]|nr:hypothetical protein J3R82DRAFT_3680 [Butyriboletus roseoflavus]
MAYLMFAQAQVWPQSKSDCYLLSLSHIHMAGITWHHVFKLITTGDAAQGKSSLLVRLTD